MPDSPAFAELADPAADAQAGEQDARWQLALQAAVLLAIDPAALGGVRLRAPAGALRDAWLSLLRALADERPLRRMPVNITDERLLGGLDLSATLATGRPVLQRGLLAETDGGLLVVPMAERLPPATAARLAQALDAQEVTIARDGLSQRLPARFALVALDEGLDEDEALAPALCDRLAFTLDLRELPARLAADAAWLALAQESIDDVRAARARLGTVQCSDALIGALSGTALALGVGSLRASLQAVAACRASAAFNGDVQAGDDDARLAATLVLAPRATRLPAPPDDAPPPEEAPPEPPPPPADAAPPEPPEPPETPPAPPDERDTTPLEERVLEAAQAAIPAGLLSQLLAGSLLRRADSGKSGAAIKGALRGRPVGSRRAPPSPGSRLHLIDTLRAAAPWQALRRSQQPPGARPARVLVRAEDFHIARIKQKTATTTLFVVDASGSSALNRLAEAKGAVELLLADCYVRRDQVALIAFRGTDAALLLPPTRSLVRAKRSLAALPGGGGTPLATAFDLAAEVADGLRRRGVSPLVVLLTDGRANVARDGSGGRERAQADAQAAARRLGALMLPLLFIDTAPRPQPEAAALAQVMRARYLPLPYADAAGVSRVVRAASAGAL